MLLRTALIACLMPAAAVAHPHVFIEAGLSFVFDAEERLAQVRVEWVYDEFYTLLLFEDLGIDPDGDLVLTDEDLARLKAADADWAPDYEGDLYGTLDGVPVALGPPVRFDLRIAGSRIVSSHFRPLAAPIPVRGHAVSFATYDPSYYAAFELTRSATVAGAEACRAEVVPADRGAAKERLEAMLRALQDSASMEVEFPPVGADFADSVRLAGGD
jgi:polyphosphate kinase